jgi:hypothetical protein
MTFHPDDPSSSTRQASEEAIGQVRQGKLKEAVLESFDGVSLALRIPSRRVCGLPEPSIRRRFPIESLGQGSSSALLRLSPSDWSPCSQQTFGAFLDSHLDRRPSCRSVKDGRVDLVRPSPWR